MREPSSMPRRTVLRVGIVGSVATLAGCSSEIIPNPTESPPPEAPSGTLVGTEPVTGGTEPSNPIQISTLSSAERDAIVEAIRTGAYLVCPDSDRSSLPEFKDRVSERSPDEAYLEYQGAYYGIYLQFSDEVYAYTAGSPEETRLTDCQ